MKNTSNRRLAQLALQNTPLLLFVVVFVVFGLLAPRFFAMQTFETIFKQASYIGIVAIGMTFVILTGGIDLSVGSNMYVSAAVAGLVMQNLKAPVWLGLLDLPGGGACSLACINAFLITPPQDRPLYRDPGHNGRGQRGRAALLTLDPDSLPRQRAATGVEPPFRRHGAAAHRDLPLSWPCSLILC
jgi:predicted ABC-type sugar transport system permease subunit